jgi:hypothetical protein
MQRLSPPAGADRASAFSFSILEEKSSGSYRGFFLHFFGPFLRGVSEKVRFLRGVLMVKAWWIGAELWSVSERSAAA